MSKSLAERLKEIAAEPLPDEGLVSPTPSQDTLEAVARAMIYDYDNKISVVKTYWRKKAKKAIAAYEARRK